MISRDFLHKRVRLGVARHAPVSARGEGDIADARAVRNAVSLELLRKEAADEDVVPFFDRRVVIVPVEGVLREADDLLPASSATQEVVEEEIVQLVGADPVIRPLDRPGRLIELLRIDSQ